MTILSDVEILKEIADNQMISPSFDSSIREINGAKCVSFGVSSYGYDIRLADTFKEILYIPGMMSCIDPHKDNTGLFKTRSAESIVVPAGCMILGSSVEYLRIPKDVMVMGTGKSTYARCGIVVNITPIEPEWEGYLTLAISNTSQLPARIYANEGICQLLFHKIKNSCKVSYRDRKGKYNNAAGIETAVV